MGIFRNMIAKEKRGLSPVIATILLVSLALVLAVIVFLWARAFIPETIQKEGRAIELSCEEVSFNAEAFATDGEVSVENTGQIPIYGIEIRKKQFLGDISQAEQFSDEILTGQSINAPLPADIVFGDTIILIPILVGEGKDGHTSYPCGMDYGIEIEVNS
jgi:flagellin-like protein